MCVLRGPGKNRDHDDVNTTPHHLRQTDGQAVQFLRRTTAHRPVPAPRRRCSMAPWGGAVRFIAGHATRRRMPLMPVSGSPPAPSPVFTASRRATGLRRSSEAPFSDARSSPRRNQVGDGGQAGRTISLQAEAIWMIASISTAAPSGSTGTPTALRAWRPASPNSSNIRSDAPFATFA